MKEGTVIEYSIKVMGVRMRWKSRIRMYEPPRAFTDEQMEGPYAFWHHTHRFLEAEGGTLIFDEIRYAMPFGVLGIAMHTLVVRSQLQKIFTHRARVISQMFGETDPLTELT
jgi:ligand-binding SRPBCC domain-containing protein